MATVKIVYPKLGIIDEFVEEVPSEEADDKADEGDTEKNNSKD